MSLTLLSQLRLPPVEAETPDARKRSVVWAYLAIVCIPGILYVKTLLPGVGHSGDTAKFQFIGHVLGTPHATGYPTYILLNYIFTTVFPFGSLAFRANLLSAVFSLIAFIFLFRILLLFQIRVTTAAITVLTFAFMQTTWFISLFAEVYSLHLLFAAAVLYYFLKFHFYRNRRDLLLGCALYSLSFGNHLTIIALLPAIFLIVWMTDRGVFRDFRTLAAIFGIISLGALQYGYLFWRYYDPNTQYLEMKTPDLKTFWWYVTGAQFKSQLFSYSLDYFALERLPAAAVSVYRQFGLFVLLVLLGFVRITNRTVQAFLLTAFVVYTLFVLNMNVFAVHYYLIISNLILAIYLANGFALLRPVRLQWALLLIPAAFVFANYNRIDQSHKTQMATQVQQILNQVQRSALILSPHYDASESFWYYLIGENKQKENIFVMHHFNPEQVRAYVRERGSIYLPEQRKDVPPNLTVYGISAIHREQLRAAGLQIEQVNDLLYRVR